MDIFTKEQRSRCMSAIRSKNTKPELLVRKYLFANGFRYRLNGPNLPGHPDLVLRKYKTAVFVNGCFWHGHLGCKYFRMPKSNTEYWETKIFRNQARDIEQRLALKRGGWHCITVWECGLKPKVREQTLELLVTTLRNFYRDDHSRPYEIPQSLPSSRAAEESPSYGDLPEER